MGKMGNKKNTGKKSIRSGPDDKKSNSSSGGFQSMGKHFYIILAFKISKKYSFI